MRNNFNASVAEVASNDIHQRAEIGFSLVGNDKALINSKIDKIFNMVDDLGLAEIIDTEMELISLWVNLKQARIYFTTSGGIQKKDDTTEGFNSAHGFIKRTLAHELDLRYMPHLKFFYDESLEYGAHIDELIESTKSKNGSNHSTY